MYCVSLESVDPPPPCEVIQVADLLTSSAVSYLPRMVFGSSWAAVNRERELPPPGRT